MRKIVIYLPAMAAMAFFAIGCRGIRMVSHWQVDPILIDGHSQDWDRVPRLIFNKSGISCAVCNNDSSLYLLLRTNDEQLGRTIIQRGLTLWFDSTAKKKKILGLGYRGKGPNMPDRANPRPSAEGQDERMRPPSMAKEMPPQGGLEIILGPKGERIPVRSGVIHAPAAELLPEGTGYTFELSVPLSASAAEFALGVRSGSVVSVCIDFAGGEPERKRRRPDGFGGGSGSGGWDQPSGDHPEGAPDGMRGPAGGGGSHGPPGANGRGKPGGEARDESSNMPSEIWVQITLVQPGSASD